MEEEEEFVHVAFFVTDWTIENWIDYPPPGDSHFKDERRFSDSTSKL